MLSFSVCMILTLLRPSSQCYLNLTKAAQGPYLLRSNQIRTFDLHGPSSQHEEFCSGYTTLQNIRSDNGVELRPLPTESGYPQ